MIYLFNRLQTVSIHAKNVTNFVVYLFSAKVNEKFITSYPKSVSSGVTWNYNWDGCESNCLLDSSATNKEKSTTLKTIRHIFMVRHGEYRYLGKRDKQKHLTKTGIEQSRLTGKRLKVLTKNWDRIISSTQTRALETAAIISDILKFQNCLEICDLLREGSPIQPEPSKKDSMKDKRIIRDGPRIEAGFKKYFYRAKQDLKKSFKDSFVLLVGHANVFRYFVCRALQLPPEAWRRITLVHGSITRLAIMPSGVVVLRSLGDCGHIPPEYITSKKKKPTNWKNF